MGQYCVSSYMDCTYKWVKITVENLPIVIIYVQREDSNVHT